MKLLEIRNIYSNVKDYFEDEELQKIKKKDWKGLNSIGVEKKIIEKFKQL